MNLKNEFRNDTYHRWFSSTGDGKEMTKNFHKIEAYLASFFFFFRFAEIANPIMKNY